MKGWWQELKDILFPIHCVKCKKEGEWLCESCFSKIVLDEPKFCPTCHRENYSGTRHAECVGTINGVVSLFTYVHGQPLSKLIEYLKYNFALETSPVFERIIVNWLEKISDTHPFLTTHQWTILPVPLHPRRKRERGFNQADVIGQILFNHLSALPELEINYNENLVERGVYTQQQARLSKNDRIENTSEAFNVVNKSHLPENVILVDDVFTTGATMQAVADVLKNEGVKTVWGFTLAHG